MALPAKRPVLTADDVRPPGVNWDFPKIRVPYFGVLIVRILLFRVLYWGPLFSETPIEAKGATLLVIIVVHDFEADFLICRLIRVGISMTTSDGTMRQTSQD